MPYEQMPIRPILVDYKCDKCGNGYMRPSGICLTSNPPQWPHRCTNCDAHMNFTEKYPTVRYTAEGELLDLKNYKPQTW